jgi:peroxiredoxin
VKAEADVDTWVLGLRLGLAVVFAVTAGAKSFNRPRTRTAGIELGVPAAAASLVAVGLPPLELAVAALLVPVATARWAASAAALMLLVFTGLLAVNLFRGRRPSCHCFGVLSDKPISGTSVARNMVLLGAAAAIAASNGGASAAHRLASATGAQLVVGVMLGVLSVVAVAQTWAVWSLVRRHGQLLLRVEQLEQLVNPGVAIPPTPAQVQLDGLPVGTAAPEFSLQGLHGELMTLAALRAGGKPVLLVFSDPGCGPCTTLAPDLARWQRERADRLRVVLVSAGPVDKNRAKAAEHGLADVLLDPDVAVASAFRFNGTPGAVLVDIRGQIASPIVSGAPAIVNLVERVTAGVPIQLSAGPSEHDHRHEHVVAQGLPVGTPAPEFRLPTVGGGEAALSEFGGRDVVVLFWNPRCGFCERLLPELLQWEQATESSVRPELLVVTTGDEAANAAQGLTSTVLLDAASSVMNSYQVAGTPIAVRVGADGLIKSPLGIGAPGVTALLNSERLEESA